MKKNKKTKMKKPNALLYFFAGPVFKNMCKKKFNLHVLGEKPKGPCVILSNHTSNQDYKMEISATYPRRVNFVGTYHWFTFKKLGFWLRAIGAIPKYQFAPDMACMKKMRYVLDNNKGMVYIAPEGTIYGEGRLGLISPSIAKTLKIFSKDVYGSRIQGAGLGNAKWALHPYKGYTEIETHLILTKEELKKLSIDEIMERITSYLEYDEFEFQKKHNILIKGDEKALGFDTMFYKCPCCGKEFTLTAKGNEIKCTNCGTTSTINDDYSFSWSGEKYFENYGEWYRWQLEKAKEEIENPNFKMEEEVEYGIDEKGIDNYVKIGKGVMTLTHDGWTYKGTKNGEEVTEHDEIEDVYFATLKIGLHFELPFKDGHCRVFYPVNDGRTSAKWSLISRALTEKELEKKKNANEQD